MQLKILISEVEFGIACMITGAIEHQSLVQQCVGQNINVVPINTPITLGHILVQWKKVSKTLFYLCSFQVLYMILYKQRNASYQTNNCMKIAIGMKHI